MASTIVERLGWTLVHFVWEGALIALVLTLALGLCRRSARVRYALACVALVLLAIAPVVTYQGLASLASASFSGTAGSSGTFATAGERIMADAVSLESLLPFVVGGWAIGVTLLSVRLGGTLLQLERWRRRHAHPAGSEWQARVDALARSLGIRRPVGVMVSDRIGVPSAWGVLKAVVVLPTSLLTQLSPAQVETILLHELAHIRRHDYLVNLLQSVVETVLFYHPAVWWVSGVVRREREHCCDDVVVARLADPMPYARALLHLEERRLVLPRPTLSAKEGNLMNRIVRILAPQPAPTRVSPLASSLAALGVLAAILGGTLQAQAQSKPPTKPVPAGGVVQVEKPAPVRASRVPKTPRFLATPPKVVPLQKKAPTRVAVQPPILKRYVWVSTPVTAGYFLQAPVAASKPAKPPLQKAAAAPAPAIGRKVAELRGPSVVGASSPTRPAKAELAAPISGPSGPGSEGVAIAAMAAPAQGGFGGGSSGGGRGAVAPVGGAIGGGFGGGMGGSNSDPVGDVTVEFNAQRRTLSVDSNMAYLTVALRQMARRTKSSIVIAAGEYGLVTTVLNDVSFEDALRILCRTGNATYRREGDVYYVTPRGE